MKAEQYFIHEAPELKKKKVLAGIMIVVELSVIKSLQKQPSNTGDRG